MTNDPLAQAYLKIIEEETKSSAVEGTQKQVGKAFGDSESEKKAKDIEPDSATENADKDMEKAVEAPKELQQTDGEIKKVSEASNPFDLLYNKILNEEESFNFSTQDNSLQPDSSFDMNTEEDMAEFDDSEEGEEEGEEITISLSRELAEKLHEALMGVLGEEEGEEGEEENNELESMEDESEEEVKEEAVEAEVCGHALVDAEKLNKGMNSPSNMEVRGAVPTTKKSAETPKTGKDSDGELKAHSPEPAVKKLQTKNNNVGGVTVGKTLFDNK